MAVRLVLAARGKWRWIPVSSKSIIRKSNDRIIQAARELNSEITPKLTGKLQESFRIEEEEHRLRMFWDVPYALYVDEGFPKSEGRYVPAIDKRLVNKALSARQQVFRQALAQGYSHTVASVALNVPVKKQSFPDYLNGYYDKTNKIIVINRNKSPEIQLRTIRHELWHALEHRAGTLEKPGKEERAKMFGEFAASLREKSIGWHPGFTGHQFSEKFLNELREAATSIVDDVIAEEFR